MSEGAGSFRDHYNESGKPKKSEDELDAELRGRMMSGDPMLAYFQQKEREKLRQTKEKPIYKGHYPPNRYNIRPGYRWDGVDRSNGHEKKLMEKKTSKIASEEEAYRWATRDL